MKTAVSECFVALTFSDNKTFKVISTIECKTIHSFTPIFAISTFLTEKLSALLPPLHGFTRNDIDHNIRQYFNPLFQFWNDYLITCVQANHAYRNQNGFYIEILLDQQSVFSHQDNAVEEVLIENGEILSKRQRFKRIFGIQVSEGNKTVGIFIAHPINQKLPFNPKINIGAILLGDLFNNQKWVLWHVYKGHIPSVQQLKSYDCIVITGSGDSVLSKSASMQQAINTLGQAYRQSDKLKIIGVCYGHQLISQYFGAEVVKKERKGGLQSIYFNSEITQKYQFLRGLEDNSYLSLSEHHEDYVISVPEGFEVIGASSSCAIESLVSKNKRILTSQFHAELPYQFIYGIMEQERKMGSGRWKYKLGQSTENIQRNVRDSLQFLRIQSEFINS